MRRLAVSAPVRPEQAMRGLLFGAVAACLALAALAPVHAQDVHSEHEEKRRQLEKLQEEIAEARERQKDLESRSTIVTRELSSLQARLVRAANLIQSTEDKATALEARVHELDGKVSRLENDLMARQGDIAVTLAALQRVSRQPPELVFLRPDDALSTLRSAHLLSAVMPTLRSEADALRHDLLLLRQLKAELENERSALAESIATLESERKDLDLLLAERREEQQQLRADTREERARLKRYAAQAESLEALIRQVEAELERRRRAAADAQARLTPRPDEPKLSAKVAPPADDKAFANAEGTLPLPVRGRFVRQFGQPDELGNPARGLTIEAREGAQVVAPFDGNVVFAGPFRDYGQILIIAHGGGYHSLLAGMSRISAVVGQKVLAGEPLGQMGAGQSDQGRANDAGGPSRTRLYLELRSNGKPINPLRWLAAGKGKVSG